MNSVILSACRTPIGKFQGAFAAIPATELGAIAIREAITRANVVSADVDEAIMGMVLPAGAGQAPARQAALNAGLTPAVSAVTINQVCGSGLKAVMMANQSIREDDAQLVVAGGMESMSRAPWLVERQLKGLGNQSLIDSLMHDGLRCAISGHAMGEIAEQLANDQGISRNDQDAFACESHRRAVAAQVEGQWNAEIAPVPVVSKSTSQDVIVDEGPRRDCSLQTLGKLKPVFSAQGTVTAGNAPMISDGAAAVVVASAAFAQSRQLTPLAEIVAATTAGLRPEDLFVAPVEAIRKLLAKTKRTVAEIDLWEINEAFAVQMLACQRSLGISSDRLNVNGGAIALGHPIGASGARVLCTLVHALQSRDREFGIAALCLGGGNAVAMLIKRLR